MSTEHDSHGHGGHDIVAHTDELLPNPGQHEHHWRPTDVDPDADKRAEHQILTLFGLSIVCVVLFVVSYFALKSGPDGDVVLGMGASNLALGLTLGGAFLFIGIGLIQWARKLMTDVELTEDRHPIASSEETRRAAVEILKAGLVESGIGRRSVLRNGLLTALGLAVVPVVVMLKDLGPDDRYVRDAAKGTGLANTVWKKGVRVVRDAIGTPIRVSDLEIGDLVNAEPSVIFDGSLEGVELQQAKVKAATVLLRMNPDDIVSDATRNWSVNGIVAYSKICTHVGCPISLNERTTHHLLCPCHQSTFDLADSGKVVFGPAGRHLPQLPLGMDDEGYLIALSDYPEPVGPSFWERHTYHADELYDQWSKENG